MNRAASLVIGMAFVIFAMRVCAQMPSRPQFTPTNYPAFGFTPTNYSVSSSKPPSDPEADARFMASQLASRNQTNPLIQMAGVPLPYAIQKLAHDAGVSYLIVPELLNKWTGDSTPIVNFTLKNVTPKEVLQRMLTLRNIALVEDPGSGIALIMPAGQTNNPLYASLSAEAIARHLSVSRDMEHIPLIEFGDVPITTAIEHLARQAGVNYLLDPTLREMWGAGGPNPTPEPQLTFRLEYVTAWAALNRMLNIYGLVLLEDPASNISYIVPADQVNNPLFAGLPANIAEPATNPIPLIQFSEVPFTTAIEHLARQAEISYMIDPDLIQMWNGSGPDHVPEPLLSIRFENVTARNTLYRLVNIYGLAESVRLPFPDQTRPKLDPALLDTAAGDSNTNADQIIPVIHFSDMPPATVLETLIRQGGLHVQLDPNLSDGTKPGWPARLSIRWEHITVKQAILAFCENYGLIIVKDDATGTILIKRYEPTKPIKHHHLQLR